MLALTSNPERVPMLRAQGVTPLLGNLDHSSSLQRLAGIAHRVVHLAPPPSHGTTDPRTLNLCRVLSKRTPPLQLVYGSTSGVYGDHQGAWIDETSLLHASTARALRRVDAEAHARVWARRTHTGLSILRIPGIYAPDRPNGTPKGRLSQGTPVLRDSEDVFTNHIHASDLARACMLALYKGCPLRIYNVNDDTVLKMGDYIDFAADLYGMTRPPRISVAQAQEQITPMQLSFMQESRRMRNQRMKKELRLRLRYATVGDGLRV
jgi:nucleoside-diphosphate-sugar epimerase